MNTRTVSTDCGSYTFMRMPNQPAIALCYGFTVDAAYRGRGLGESAGLCTETTENRHETWNL